VPRISVLPDHIASQIAAGEVIERPSSVVKEFVENSIDSGATKVEVTVSADCRDIRVADNGCGMEREDATLAFQRHATSKLRSADDLWRLDSLGFRGEALPSIASISHMTCTTRTHETQSGCRVSYEDGTVSVNETGCAPGTVMQITDLFYNVPARLSFLKKPATEFAHIHETVQALSIAHPQIAFSLLKHDETVLRTSGSGDLSGAVVEAGHFTGRESLIEVRAGDANSDFEVRGYIARPLHFRGDRKGILTIVNKRPVRCALTFRALDYAYSDLIPRGKNPLAVLHTRINPAQVDVNVHPSKKELRYTDGNSTYVALQRAITQALREATRPVHSGYGDFPSKQYSVQEGGTDDLVTAGASPSARAGDAGDVPISFMESAIQPGIMDHSNLAAPQNINAHFRTEQVRESIQVKQIDFVEDLRLNSSGVLARANGDASYDSTEFGDLDQNGKITSLPPDWRIAGYIHNTYIFIETAEGMQIVEQHIAHERTLYERILARQTVRGRVTDDVQPFLVSAPLDLSPEQSALLDANFEMLNQLGFDFKRDIDGTVAATQVPLELSGKNYSVVIQELLDQISKADSANLQLEATKSLACQAAIKNGMQLGSSDIHKLLIDWLNSPRNDTCPHGRPIRMKYSMDRLFQIFHP
jgi:DNA mismatch repair protein MutL